MSPEIDLDKCDGVGACVETCPLDVWELVDNKGVVAQPDDCVECGACVDACPVGAITLP
ncbi:MAG TPA: ferredoxin family protein [Methanosarcinaceae archaeon]|nr:ferredoxin family protein [Methanosarcinaceae archaeon]